MLLCKSCSILQGHFRQHLKTGGRESHFRAYPAAMPSDRVDGELRPPAPHGLDLPGKCFRRKFPPFLEKLDKSINSCQSTDPQHCDCGKWAMVPHCPSIDAVDHVRRTTVRSFQDQPSQASENDIKEEGSAMQEIFCRTSQRGEVKQSRARCGAGIMQLRLSVNWSRGRQKAAGQTAQCCPPPSWSGIRRRQSARNSKMHFP